MTKLDNIKCSTWMGKALGDYSKEELIEIVEQLGRDNTKMREEKHESDLKWMDSLVKLRKESCY